MKVLHIGHYSPGCTTYMRGEHIKKLMQPEAFVVADIDIPHATESRLSKSVGWRFKVGPLLKAINQYVYETISHHRNFDLVWVDKGVFLDPQILANLKERGSKLIHYTPDTAFYHNRSKLFYKALPLYDYCITTKSFEVDNYYNAGAKKVLFCTQGYDPALHKPYYDFKDKAGVVFVGHNEPSREVILSALLERKIEVKLAGARWRRFSKKFSNSSLHYYGEGLYGETYARLISGSIVGLGLLSKKFPELHTTRTFEIPACGTILATERNAETASYYDDNEVLFYRNPEELADRIQQLLFQPDESTVIATNGHKKVISRGYDYPSILKRILIDIGVF